MLVIYFKSLMFCAVGVQGNHVHAAHTRHHAAHGLVAVTVTRVLAHDPPAFHPAPSHSRAAWPPSSASRKRPRLLRPRAPRAPATPPRQPRAHLPLPLHPSPALLSTTQWRKHAPHLLLRHPRKVPEAPRRASQRPPSTRPPRSVQRCFNLARRAG